MVLICLNVKFNSNVSLMILCAFFVFKNGVSRNFASNISLSSSDKLIGLSERGLDFIPSIPFSFHLFNH